MANALKDFRTQYGPDFLHLLPSLEQLSAMFRSAPRQVSVDRDGEKFAHKFVELDYRDTDGVYLLFTLGSGSKLDKDLKQPALARLNEVVRRVQPGLLFAKHVHRFGRHAWQFGPVVTELDSYGGFLGDAEKGIRRMESLDSVMLFFEATRGEDEAKGMVPRTRKGMREATWTSMVDGVVRVGAHTRHPPGLARLRLRDRAHQGASVLAFDRAASLPDPSSVAYGYPDVRGADGNLVDQVENVRWALTQLGKQPVGRIGRELIRRGFSTTGVRQKGGPDARVTDPHGAVYSIVRNLDFYRTGELTIRLGADFDDIVVSGCMPEGGWASPESFARIDRWLAQRQELEAARSKSTFGGHPLVFNGSPGQLAAYKPATDRTGTFTYRIDPDVATGERAHNAPTITHEFLAKTLIEGLAAGGDQALRLIPVQLPVPLALCEQEAALQAQIGSLQANMRSIEEQLEERDAEGALIVTGAILGRKVERYNELATNLLDLERSLQGVRAEIARAEEVSRRTEAAALADQLLELVRALRDPHSLDHQYVWRSALSALEITTAPRFEGGLVGQAVTVSGHLRVGDGLSQATLPFRGTFDTATSTIEKRVDQVLAEWRTGVPLRRTAVPNAPALKHRLAAALGRETRRFGLAVCDDPRILRAAMLTCHPEDGVELSVSHAAERLGEPVAFVERVQHIWGVKQPGQWRLVGAPSLVALHVAAATGGGSTTEEGIVGVYSRSHVSLANTLRMRGMRSHWSFRRGRWSITPCALCGSVAFAPALIREPADSVCLGCWHDRHGVAWPMDPYVHLIDGLDAWRDAGLLPPHLPDNPFGVTCKPRRRPYRAQGARAEPRPEAP